MKRQLKSNGIFLVVTLLFPLFTLIPANASIGTFSAINSYNVAVDSHNSLLYARNSCYEAVSKANMSRRILSETNAKRFCAYLDRDIEKVYREVKKRENLLDSYDNSVLMRVRDFMILAEIYFELATESLDSSTILGIELLDVSIELGKIDTLYEEISKSTNSIDSVLDYIPRNIASKISKEEQFYSFRKLVGTLEEAYSGLTSSIDKFGKTTEPSIDNYNNLVSAIRTFQRKIPKVQDFNSAIRNTQRLFPSAYCLKGNLAQNLVKTNCPKGFKKVTIDVPVSLKLTEFVIGELSTISNFAIIKPQFLDKRPLFQNVTQTRVVETSSEFSLYFVAPNIPATNRGKVSLEIGFIIGDPWKKAGNGLSINTRVFDPFVEIFKSVEISESVTSIKFSYAELSEWASSTLGITLEGQSVGLTTRVQSGDALSKWSFETISPSKGIICLNKFSTNKPPLVCSN
jgi:hypothetical protein